MTRCNYSIRCNRVKRIKSRFWGGAGAAVAPVDPFIEIKKTFKDDMDTIKSLERLTEAQLYNIHYYSNEANVFLYDAMTLFDKHSAQTNTVSPNIDQTTFYNIMREMRDWSYTPQWEISWKNQPIVPELFGIADMYNRKNISCKEFISFCWNLKSFLECSTLDYPALIGLIVIIQYKYFYSTTLLELCYTNIKN